MPDTHYLNPKLAAIFDLDSPWYIDREFYLALAGTEQKSILDLCCGTGLLCDAYAARGHDVTGIDPAEAMLQVARQKPHGKQIEWILSHAQNHRSDKLFDLIIMTGHAFQVLLKDDEILSTFAVIRQHLKPDGRAVFESRNPNIKWVDRWNYDMEFDSPAGRVHESRRFVDMTKDRMISELHYQFPDEKLVSRSELRFATRAKIEDHLARHDLRATSVLGDWDGTLFDERTSEEMIFIVQHSKSAE